MKTSKDKRLHRQRIIIGRSILSAGQRGLEIPDCLQFDGSIMFFLGVLTEALPLNSSHPILHSSYFDYHPKISSNLTEVFPSGFRQISWKAREAALTY